MMHERAGDPGGRGRSLQSTAVEAARNRLLLVEDNADDARIVTRYLEQHGFHITTVDIVSGMRAVFSTTEVALVILDIGLPDEDGWSALRWLRQRGDTPVIMLTGLGDDVDKIVGLELGADDFVTKPCGLRELLARIRTVLRRSGSHVADPASTSPSIHFGEWILGVESQLLKSTSGTVEHLTQAEFRILSILARSPLVATSRDQLMDALGRAWDPLDRSIDVHISNLRRKLDHDSVRPSLIRTVRGIGYMLVPDRG